MAQRQTVTVLAVEQRQSQNGKAYWRIRTDSGVYFAWSKEVVDQLPAGTTAVVSINGSAEYPRIVAVHEAPVEHEASEPVASAPAAPPAPAGDRERRMLRMSALRAAAEVLHGTGLPAEQVTAYAETLLAWLEA